MQILPKVLLVEDDRSIATALAQVLQTNYQPTVAATAQAAVYKADSGHYDIILLDLNLPDMPGAEVCRQWRERGLETPILVLTADTHTLTKVNLLDAGANDYLTKPFSVGELKARMRALTRTHQQPRLQPARKLSVSGIELDRQTFEVHRNGTPLHLRRKEFVLLECLMEHAGTVVTRRALTRYAWQGAEDLWTNTIDVHIKYLRDKLDRPFDRRLIRTVHGIGYKLEAVPAAMTVEA
jgi:DNA-binding response OmpR family regulator